MLCEGEVRVWEERTGISLKPLLSVVYQDEVHGGRR